MIGSRWVSSVAPVGLLCAATFAACSESVPDSSPSASPRGVAQDFVDKLEGNGSCDDLWKLVISDGELKEDFCADLPAYRDEVRSLTLGDELESSDDWVIFEVRVDYADGSPPVTDSELEVDFVNGVPKVAAGLP